MCSAQLSRTRAPSNNSTTTDWADATVLQSSRCVQCTAVSDHGSLEQSTVADATVLHSSTRVCATAHRGTLQHSWQTPLFCNPPHACNCRTQPSSPSLIPYDQINTRSCQPISRHSTPLTSLIGQHSDITASSQCCSVRLVMPTDPKAHGSPPMPPNGPTAAVCGLH